MTSQLQNDNQIIFGKWWAKNQGWAATADIEKGIYWKAVNHKFLPSNPLNDEEKEKITAKNIVCIFAQFQIITLDW